MWKIGSLSILGKGHEENSLENQDRFKVLEREDCVIIIMSDGAGSAEYGASGAQAIIDTCNESFSQLDGELFKNFSNSSERFINVTKGAVTTTRFEISQGNYAKKEKKFSKFFNFFNNKKQIEEAIDLDDFAATLLVAILSPTEVWTAHIGDGYMAGLKIEEDNSFSQKFASLPENGEYSNQTYFFTDENWEEHFRTNHSNEAIDFFACMTDGADPFLISNDRENLDKNITEKILEFSKKHTELHLNDILAKMFIPEKIYSVTNDDTTFCLVIRETE